ncbi:MAG: DNA polymerase I, partial [Lachnospiraceae bacterium]|nr:DNA polymerase I [Candidatus Equihabitans merdae]
RFEISEEQKPSSIGLEIIEKKKDFFKLIAKAVKAERIGISLAVEKGILYGAGLALDDKTYGLAVEAEVQASFDFSSMGIVSDQGDGLTEAVIKEGLEEVLSADHQKMSCDVKGLRKYFQNYDEGKYFDSVVAAYLLAPLKSDHAYDDISSEYLGITCPSKEELVGKKGYAKAADKKAIASACAYEAAVALMSEPMLTKKLEETGMTELFEKVEMPLTTVLASMENLGILADRAKLKEYGQELSTRIDALTEKIYEAAGENFNINSPRQLGDILFVKMGLPGGKKTKTGYSTAAEVLDRLAPEVPFVSDVLEYRQLTKLKSTYADALADYIAEDGRIHTTFN